MEIRIVEDEKRDYLTKLKVKSKPIFSQDEIEYLLDGTKCGIYEFKQESDAESDMDFYHNFITWLKETEFSGYIYYYVIMGLRKNEFLTLDELEYLEKNITSSFETGYGWITATNHELRFKRRIKLLVFEKESTFHRLVYKG